MAAAVVVVAVAVQEQHQRRYHRSFESRFRLLDTQDRTLLFLVASLHRGGGTASAGLPRSLHFCMHVRGRASAGFGA